MNSDPKGIVPLSAFSQITGATSLQQLRLDPRTRVQGEREFQEMVAHTEWLNRGVQAQHSFEDAAGQVFDCVPIDQQPSLRASGGQVAVPPDLTGVLEGRPPVKSTSVQPRQMQSVAPLDRHGNAMQAPPGTIPIRRVSVEEMARFKDLREFFRKSPLTPTLAPALGQPPGMTRVTPSAPSTDVNQNHRYAYTHQAVDNIGANNSLSVHAPAVNSNQVFSLAQHWYSAGSGSAHQTLECGWQVYPAKYGHAQPVLFIYWTADNYQTTGAYNLDAPGFVQTNSSVTIGGALSPVSTQGGQQQEIELCVFLSEGNWWLYYGGLTADNAVGYYPTSIYSGGGMATKAENILFGGETVCSSVSWPPMGSGTHASTGWQQAAYQRNIYYFPPGGGAQWATLIAEQPSPACYTLQLGAAAAPWGVYFFYGGPGGSDC